MSKMESILEEILEDAVETYVSENLEKVIRDIRGILSEDKKTLEQALDAVLDDWLTIGDGYFFIREDMGDQAERSCDYEYDCEKIIFEYGFTRSLEAAKHQGVRLYDTDESTVAAAVLRENLPENREIRNEMEAQIRSTAAYQKLVDEEKEKAGCDAKGDAGRSREENAGGDC